MVAEIKAVDLKNIFANIRELNHSRFMKSFYVVTF